MRKNYTDNNNIEENLTGEGGWSVKIKDRHGTIRYLNEFGRLHREDGPAEIHYIGTKTYYKNGEIHRDNEPAVYYTNGSIAYYKNGLMHNDNGPAYIHMLDGKAVVTEYRINGKLHREDGPALEWDTGGYQYYKNGLLHREDGPSICNINPENQENTYDYYLNGRFVPKGLFKLYQIGNSIFKTESKVEQALDEIITSAKKRKM